jgi:hypothetical protein
MIIPARGVSLSTEGHMAQIIVHLLVLHIAFDAVHQIVTKMAIHKYVMTLHEHEHLALLDCG